jgi:hypothetical protein
MIGDTFVQEHSATPCHRGQAVRVAGPFVANERWIARTVGARVRLRNIRNGKSFAYPGAGGALSATGLWLQKASGAVSVVALP